MAIEKTHYRVFARCCNFSGYSSCAQTSPADKIVLDGEIVAFNQAGDQVEVADKRRSAHSVWVSVKLTVCVMWVESALASMTPLSRTSRDDYVESNVKPVRSLRFRARRLRTLGGSHRG